MARQITKEQKAWGESLIADELKDYNLNIMKLAMTTNKFGEPNIELRVKPQTPNRALINELESKLASYAVTKHALSPNSGKYASLSFQKYNITYDLIVADGANKGESFEQQLIDDLKAGDGMAPSFIDALLEADQTVKYTVNFRPGEAGVGRRRSHLPPEAHGKAIADVVLELEDGSERYVSVKNKHGQTLANLGKVRDAFDGYRIDPLSDVGTLLTSLGVDLVKIETGLSAYGIGDVDFECRQPMHVDIVQNSVAWSFLERAWGYNYIYAQYNKSSFTAFTVDKEMLHSVLINGLTVTRIHYPHRESKQLSIHFGNDLMDYKLELRNPHGPTGIVPTDAKLVVKRSWW